MKSAETLSIAKRLGILLVLSFTLLASQSMRVIAQWSPNPNNCPWCSYDLQYCYDMNDQAYDACTYAADAQNDACLSNSATNYNDDIDDCNFWNPPPQGCYANAQSAKNTRDAACAAEYSWNTSNCDSFVDYGACNEQFEQCLRDCE